MRRFAYLILPLLVIGFAGFAIAANGLSPMEQLGKSIYFDQNLSLNRNQACAACHAPEVGFTGPIEFFNAAGSVYEGSVPGRFGNRKPPSAAYATTSPIFHLVVEKGDELFVGGNFWDGRATGDNLGNPAADQAIGPFLNPVEMGLSDNACVVYRVCTAPDYPVAFGDVWPGGCDIAFPPDTDLICEMEGMAVPLSPEDRYQVDISYGNVGRTIAAFEGSSEVNSYSSKFDYWQAGLAEFTKEEKKGFQMFKSKGKCDLCHVLDPGPMGEPPLFTDYTFDNLGVPKNVYNPIYDVDPDFVDLGLGGFLMTQGELWASMAEDNLGKQKVPTLRNVAKAPYPGFVKAFSHNGYFKTLGQIVHFYNTRDVKPVCDDPLTPVEEAMAQDCWPAPEVMENVNHDELGDLHLTPSQEAAIVAFLETLSDGYMP